MTVGIEVEGLRELQARVRRLPKVAQAELREASQAIADMEAPRLRGAASASSRQAGAIASSIRVRRDRFPAIAAGGRGRTGVSGGATAGQLFYGASKAAVVMITKSLALELAPAGIRVNGILIGLVESGQWRRRFEAREERDLDWAQWTARLAQQKHIPLGRLGLPIEAARAILFLASPLSAYTTGSHIDVSGGLSRHA